MDKNEALSEQLETPKPQDEHALDGIVMPQSLSALTPDEYNKLGRVATLKMDLAIMPIMVIMYILNYLDRQNIASAKLANIEEDLKMSDVQYQTSVSILFCGYSKSTPLTAAASPNQHVYSSDAGTLQHDRRSNQVARTLHLPRHGRLGCSFSMHGLGAQLRRSSRR